jgi:hypothetical protein
VALFPGGATVVADPARRLYGGYVSVIAPTTALFAGSVTVTADLDYEKVSVTSDRPDRWEGSVTVHSFIGRGGLAFDLAGTTITTTVATVQEAQADGLSVYTLTLRPPVGEAALALVIPDTGLLPRDPWRAVEQGNYCLEPGEQPAYVLRSGVLAMRGTLTRPTARDYFLGIAQTLGVALRINDDVIGADARMPVKDVWDGTGKTLGNALEEVFGFGKPEIYVAADGAIVVRRTPTPTAFSALLADAERRTLTDLETTVSDVDFTYFAAAREFICADEVT